MTKISKQRSSLNISLVLIGTLAISCGQSGYRSVYNSREDCLADWNSPEKCEQMQRGGSNYYPGRYYGPWVAGDYASSSRANSRAIGHTSVSRGGFGSSSSSHSRGG